jgi:hypothetical protein
MLCHSKSEMSVQSVSRRWAWGGIAALGLIAVCVNPVAAQQKLTEQFLQTYRSHLDRLHNKYVWNKHCRATYKRWGEHEKSKDKRDVRLDLITEIDARSDDRTVHMSLREKHLVGGHDIPRHIIWSPEEVFKLERNKEKTGFFIFEHETAKQYPASHDSARTFCPLFYPFKYDFGYTIASCFENRGAHSVIPAEIAVLSIRPGQWKGQPVTTVEFRNTYRNPKFPNSRDLTYNHLIHFDHKNDWAVRAIETPNTNKRPDKFDRRTWVNRQVVEVEYEDGSDGYPVPARHAEYNEYLDGGVVNKVVCEVETFEPYTPKPGEELGLAAFGLSHPVQEATAVRTRSYAWLLIVAAVAVGAVAAVLLLRGRRRPDEARRAVLPAP